MLLVSSKKRILHQLAVTHNNMQQLTFIAAYYSPADAASDNHSS